PTTPRRTTPIPTTTRRTTLRRTTPRRTTPRRTTPRRTTPRRTTPRRTTPQPIATTNQGPLECSIDADPVCTATTSGVDCPCGDVYEEWAECRIWGAAHYITFDGHSYDVQTGCWQTLIAFHLQEKLVFSVTAWLMSGRGEVDNYVFDEEAKWPDDVSFINMVELTLGQNTYTIHRDKTIRYQGGKPLTIPIEHKTPNNFQQPGANIEVRLYEEGEMVHISVPHFGIELSYSGRGTGRVHLKLHPVYKNNGLAGMCGNFNGDPDDDFREDIRHYVNPGRIFAMIHRFGGCA
ncbi:unnamed protein product, partial [Owenia fusiformis]